MNIKDAQQVLNNYMEHDIPCFLWGAPGVGKSDSVRQTAKALGDWPVIDFRAILRDPVDLRGLPSIDTKERVARWLPPDDLPNEKRDGKQGILFLDELNAAPQSVQAACFGLVLDRKVGDYRLPKGWRVVAAGNRQSDRAAAQRMPSALANRFAHIDIDPDVDTFADWAVQHDINPLVIAFLKYRPALLHDMKSPDGKDLISFPTPRAWASVSKVAGIQNNDSLRMKLVSGLIGFAAANEFEAFVRIVAKLPELEDLIAHPKTAMVPDEVAQRYAVATGLARKATTKNISAILQYTSRMPKEFQMMCVIQAIRRDNTVTKNSEFIKWMAENRDFLL